MSTLRSLALRGCRKVVRSLYAKQVVEQNKNYRFTFEFQIGDGMLRVEDIELEEIISRYPKEETRRIE